MNRMYLDHGPFGRRRHGDGRGVMQVPRKRTAETTNAKQGSVCWFPSGEVNFEDSMEHAGGVK